MMEAALRALLINDGPLTTLVPGDRIVWNHLPQDTPRPAIALYRVAGAVGLTYRGRDGLLNARAQLDIQALTVSSMWAIRSAALGLLHGHRGAGFRGIFALSERQSVEELAGVLLHRASIDLDIWSVED